MNILPSIRVTWRPPFYLYHMKSVGSHFVCFCENRPARQGQGKSGSAGRVPGLLSHGTKRGDALEAQGEGWIFCWPGGRNREALGLKTEVLRVMCIFQQLFLSACSFASHHTVRYKRAKKRKGWRGVDLQPSRICVLHLFPAFPILTPPPPAGADSYSERVSGALRVRDQVKEMWEKVSARKRIRSSVGENFL